MVYHTINIEIWTILSPERAKAYVQRCVCHNLFELNKIKSWVIEKERTKVIIVA